MVEGGRERGGRAVVREEVPAEEQHGGGGGGDSCASILLRNGACTPTGIPSLTISSKKRLGLEIRLVVSTMKGHVSSSLVPEQTRLYVRTA